MFVLRRVHGRSMAPLMQPNQLVLAARWKQPKVGDVVVFHHEGREKIKQITKYKKDKLYVSGVNKTMSTDSDVFGWLDEDSVIGVVFWPLKKR